MLGNRFGSESTRFDDDPVVIGLFPNASDARRALDALHENQYPPDQITAAFRTPADSQAEVEATSVPMRGSGKWFGQLREIYRGEDGGVDRAGAAQSRPEVSTTGFDAMLAQIDLSPQDTLTLDHDFDRGAAIVAVRAGRPQRGGPSPSGEMWRTHRAWSPCQLSRREPLSRLSSDRAFHTLQPACASGAGPCTALRRSAASAQGEGEHWRRERSQGSGHPHGNSAGAGHSRAPGGGARETAARMGSMPYVSLLVRSACT